MASREWGLKKEAIRERSGGKCERCWISNHEVTHHETYAHLGNEPLEDLLGICRLCHHYLHGKSSFDPASLVFGMDGVIEGFRKWGQSLPLNPDAFSEFNRAIQVAVENCASDRKLAGQLAQVKLEINQRLYNVRKGLRFL